MYELILIEIVAVPAERRKMSSFPTKARAAPAAGQVFSYADHIRVVAPTGSAADQAPPPRMRAKHRPKRGWLGKAVASPGRWPWLAHVRAWRVSGLARAAYCERHGLNPRAFHKRVACARQIVQERS